jgi:hypothetical protein
MQTLQPEQADDLRRFEGVLAIYPDSNAKKAHELATLIGSAYTQLEQQGQGTWKIPKGYNLIQELKHNRGSNFFGLANQRDRLFGFIALRDKNAFIVIRGTRTTYEWFNNTATSYKEYFSVSNPKEKWGITTEGFHSIYVDLRVEIMEALAKIQGKYDHIFVTGHSLGGALATLALPDLLDGGISANKINVYTFASPRCVDRQFAMRLNKSGVQHWRIANTEDIVPTLPGATANIFSPENKEKLPEEGAERTEENFIVKTYKKLKADGMRTLEHTGTPIYFTVGTNSMQDNHNLEIVYMTGIGQPPSTLP